MTAIRPGTCAMPGPHDQHCTERPGHPYSCYDAEEDASFNAGVMLGGFPEHECDDPSCEGMEAYR